MTELLPYIEAFVILILLPLCRHYAKRSKLAEFGTELIEEYSERNGTKRLKLAAHEKAKKEKMSKQLDKLLIAQGFKDKPVKEKT